VLIDILKLHLPATKTITGFTTKPLQQLSNGTTLDQMFTGEQFEAYRALGFHAALGLFDRSDSFAHLDAVRNADVWRQTEYLVQLFPRMSPENGDSLRLKQTFTEWSPLVMQRRRHRADNYEGI